tara:strand:+ start:273 stop:2162 length:1890 start_codon:yes stop_codon:yes gene_type:complete
MPTTSYKKRQLASVATILVDSSSALEYGYELGLPRDAVVRTSSPSLLLNSNFNTEPIDQLRKIGDLQSLGEETTPLTISIYEALAGLSYTRDLALTAARSASLFQRTVSKASLLRDSDFQKPIATLSLDTGSLELDRQLNYPWHEILLDHPEAYIIKVPPERAQLPKTGQKRSISAYRRASLAPFSGFGYWVFRELWKCLPVRSPNGCIAILTENPLVRETAFHLATKGFAIRTLLAPQPNPEPLARKLEDLLTSLIQPILREYLGRWLSPVVSHAVEKKLLENTMTDVRRHRSSIPLWHEKLDRLATDNPVAILSNYPKWPESSALHHVAREREIPVVAFQHGISREISSATASTQANYENSSCDLFITYTRRNVEISESNPFLTGKSIAAGLPDTYWRAGRYRKPRPNAPPIMYVSTQLYTGNIQLIRGDANDLTIANHEISIIDRVLSRIPHQILYKTYPATRYLDPDPVTLQAMATDNITVFEDNLDLRYLLPDAKVLVTSRATSTLGWCFMSKKPLVFIDIPNSLPLEPAARNALQQAVFLFDASESNFLDQLAKFLSQPIRNIEQLYKDMESKRVDARDRFFQTGGHGAGKRAARMLVESIKMNSSISNDIDDGIQPTQRLHL